ncbi:MAG: hypothetical protein INQ03_15290 [Candidatus Heimdallarchaeota archaeon]|nr:hypothetical protein [Candidatus Heimdallarchaeota archaeon]
MIKKVMELLTRERVISAQSVSSSLGISLDKAKTILTILQDQGLIHVDTHNFSSCDLCTGKSCSRC